MLETIYFILDIIAMFFLLISLFFFLKLKDLEKRKMYITFSVVIGILFLVALMNVIAYLYPGLDSPKMINDYALIPLAGLLMIIGIKLS